MAFDADNDVRLKAGSFGDLGGSMAEAMLNAFKEEWRLRQGDDLNVESQDMLQMVFSAISQGVVRHLVDNREAFKIDVTVDQQPNDADGTWIKSSNEVETAIEYRTSPNRWVVPEEAMEVRQVSIPITSLGAGKVVEVRVEGELY